MAYHTEKIRTGIEEIVIDGFMNGIQPSPHKGIADMKNLNINSLEGEASVNFNRLNTLPSVTSATVAGTASAPSIAYLYGVQSKLVVGSCIVPSASTITGFTVSKPYWVTAINSDNGTFQFVSITNQYGSTNITPGTTGSATISTYPLHKFVQGATEYDQSNNAYIYYLCDILGSIWVNNPAVYGIFSPVGDTNGIAVATGVTGFGVSQAYAFVFGINSAGNHVIFSNCTYTINVFNPDTGRNQGWQTAQLLKTPMGIAASHYVLKVPDQNGSLYYCDSQWIGQISGVSDQFSFMTITSSGTTTQTVTTYNQGVVPIDGLAVSVVAKVGASIPVGLTAGTQYYIKTGSYNQGAGQLQVATTPGGSAISVAAGSFYLTSFDPTQTGMTEITIEALALQYDELSYCLEYLSQGGGIALAIGTISNNLYFWSPGTSAPSAALPLPEFGIYRLLNVDNTIYVFVGNRGNIYQATGSQIAGVFSIPDYIADQYGTNQNPWFVWGDCMFLSGRVWFSIQDQNSGNTTGNCGGIWSFTPTQNLFLGQDQGVKICLENQNSYGTYNGVCDVLLRSENQKMYGAQYWSCWSSSYTNPNFGIDFSGTLPYNTLQYGQIDTDIIPVGTMLTPFTPSNIEYKLSRPLTSGETIELQMRPDLTSSFASLGVDSTATNLSFKFPTVLQNMQWMQFRIKLTSTATNPSYLTITELRIRP